MLITIPMLPLLLAYLLILLAYLRLSIEGIFENIGESLIDARIYDAHWLVREYGVAGFAMLRAFQGFPEVRCVVQRI